MRPRPKSCTVCGRRVEDGLARCELHRSQAGTRARSCVVCGRPTMRNYCDAHDPQLDEERMERQPWRKEYRDPEYRRNRQVRFERSRGRCEACGELLEPGWWDCHHVIALRDGGTNAIENLRIICDTCHKSATRQARRTR